MQTIGQKDEGLFIGPSPRESKICERSGNRPSKFEKTKIS